MRSNRTLARGRRKNLKNLAIGGIVSLIVLLSIVNNGIVRDGTSSSSSSNIGRDQDVGGYPASPATSIGSHEVGMAAAIAVENNRKVMEILKKQEQVILSLTKEVEHLRQVNNGGSDGSGGEELRQVKSLMEGLEVEVARQKQAALKNEQQAAKSELSSGVQHEPPQSQPLLQTSHQKECDGRFGRGLLESWMQSSTEVCSGGTSRLVCYTHRHPWRQDTQSFCVASNFVIDFSKVEGRHGPQRPPRGPQQYHTFRPGSLQADCKKNGKYASVPFMPHASLQMRSFQDDTPWRGSDDGGTEVIDSGPTYLLTRDEDSENAFHSTSDFINMHTVFTGLGIANGDAQVVLFDRQPDGPFKVRFFFFSFSLFFARVVELRARSFATCE